MNVWFYVSLQQKTDVPLQMQQRAQGALLWVQSVGGVLKRYGILLIYIWLYILAVSDL